MKRTPMRIRRPGGPFAQGPRLALSPVRHRPPMRAGDRLGHPAGRPPRARRRAAAALAIPIIALLLAVLPASDLRAVETPEASAFLTELSERVIAQLAEPGVAQAERERRFRALFEDSFDIPAIGRFVLGRYWRAASKEERAAFLDAFEEVIVRRFLPLFNESSGVSLIIDEVRPNPNRPSIVTVASRVQRAQGEPVRVAWRLREHGGGHRIVDVVAEGVSIAITLRSEYASFVAQHGGSVSALVASLRRQLAAGGQVSKVAGNDAVR